VRRAAVLLLVVLVIQTLAGVAAADVRGSPNLSATLTDDTVAPGEDVRLEFTLSNAGRIDDGGNPQSESRVTTARGVRATVEAGDAPLSVETGPVALGSIPDGAAVPVGALVHVDEDAEPGTYDVRLTVEYVHTSRIETGPNGTDQVDRTVERTLEVELVVEERPRFEVVAARSSAVVGESGTVTLTVRNEGATTANAATLTARSSDTGLSLGGAPAATTALGDVEPDENRTVSLPATVTPSTTAREFPVETTVAYEDANGVPARDTDTTRVGVGAEQTFAVVDARTDAAVGERGDLTLAIRNTADRRLTDASLSVRSPNAALTFGGTPTAEAFVGDWEAGEVRRISLSARVAPEAERRSYALSVTPSYTNAAGESARAEPLSTGVVPAAEQSFRVVFRRAQVPIGGSGTVTLGLRNEGRDVEDVSLSVRSPNAALTFGGTPTAEAFVGDWEAGEVRRISLSARVAPEAERRSYTLDATASYTTAGDREGRSTFRTGITPRPERTFSVADGSVDVRVGDEGTITGTLVNNGSDRVENAVLVLEPPGRTIDVGEAEVAVGDLDPGARVDFAFELDASEAATAGPRQFTLRVRYDDGDGTTSRSGPLYVRGSVEPQRKAFSVSTAGANFTSGGSGELVLQVRNNGDQPVRDVSAKLFADDPVSANDDEAYVQRLAPGETTTVTFTISVGGGALRKAYPVSVDFQYDEPDGDTKLSDTYRVPVTVGQEEEQSGGLSALPGAGSGVAGGLAVGAVALLAVVLVAVRGYRRR